MTTSDEGRIDGQQDGAATPSKEVARFADVAMYEATPMTATEPEVYLLSANPDPLGDAAAAIAMYRGQVIRDTDEVTDDQRREVLTSMRQTKLKAPLEFIKMHFLIEGVSRSFTHQQVRQRTAVYAQESLRFAVKDGASLPVKLPPSIGRLKEDAPARVVWDKAIKGVGEAYDALISAGVPAEDARELLPGGTLTRLHYSTDFRNLLEHAGNRLCTQAQFEWRTVFFKVAQALQSFGREQTYRDRSTGEWRSSQWQYDELASFFRPACYLTGKCEFAAMDLDRACRIRDRVDAFHEHGVPSDQWTQGALNLGIPGISPAEWMLDDGAARVAPGRGA